LAVSQNQSLALFKQARLLRSLVQSQTLALGLTKVVQRTLTTAQAQSVVLLKQTRSILGASQNQTLALVRQPRLMRTISQAQTPGLSLLKILRRTLSFSQAQTLSVGLLKVIQRTLSAQQAQLVRLLFPTKLTLQVSQPQQLSLATHISTTYLLVLTLGQPQTAQPVGLFVMGPERTFLAGYRCRRFAVAGRGLRFCAPSRSRRFGVRTTAGPLLTVIGPIQRRRPPSTPMIRRR
jgi:hypothetical protein